MVSLAKNLCPLQFFVPMGAALQFDTVFCTYIFVLEKFKDIILIHNYVFIMRVLHFSVDLSHVQSFKRV